MDVGRCGDLTISRKDERSARGEYDREMWWTRREGGVRRGGYDHKTMMIR